jgi:hypothetical protein
MVWGFVLRVLDSSLRFGGSLEFRVLELGFGILDLKFRV